MPPYLFSDNRSASMLRSGRNEGIPSPWESMCSAISHANGHRPQSLAHASGSYVLDLKLTFCHATVAVEFLENPGHPASASAYPFKSAGSLGNLLDLERKCHGNIGIRRNLGFAKGGEVSQRITFG